MYGSPCYSILAVAFVKKMLLQELHLFSMYHSLTGWLMRLYYPTSMQSLAYSKAKLCMDISYILLARYHLNIYCAFKLVTSKITGGKRLNLYEFSALSALWSQPECLLFS